MLRVIIFFILVPWISREFQRTVACFSRSSQTANYRKYSQQAISIVGSSGNLKQQSFVVPGEYIIYGCTELLEFVLLPYMVIWLLFLLLEMKLIVLRLCASPASNHCQQA